MLVKGAYDNLLLPDKIWRFVWKDPENAVPEFIRELFHTPAVRHQIKQRATGTSGSMKNISAEKLMGVEVISPPVSVQREFAACYCAAWSAHERGMRHLRLLDTLFESVQHRAFAGEL